MNKIVFTLLLAALLMRADAQVSYTFKQNTATYQELSGAKKISFAQMDSLKGLYQLNELDGETFRWYGVDFRMDSIKTFYVQPYANVRMNNDSSIVIVDAAFTYMDSIDDHSSISYKIDGSPGDRIIKCQWKNMKMRGGQALNFINVQIWVYQKSGVFEIRYGPSSSNNQSGYNIGSGPNVGIFYSPLDFAKCYAKLWITGSPSSVQQDSFANYNFKAMLGIPPEGVVFRFTPRFKTLDIHSAYRVPLVLYPNPVSGLLSVSRPCDYRICDSYGRTVMEGRTDSLIDISSLPSGIYTFLGDLAQPVKLLIGK